MLVLKMRTIVRILLLLLLLHQVWNWILLELFATRSYSKPDPRHSSPGLNLLSPCTKLIRLNYYIHLACSGAADEVRDLSFPYRSLINEGWKWERQTFNLNPLAHSQIVPG